MYLSHGIMSHFKFILYRSFGPSEHALLSPGTNALRREVCKFVCRYTCVYVCIMCACLCVSLCVCVNMCICMHVCVHCAHVSVHIKCACLCVCVCLCMYVHMCIKENLVMAQSFQLLYFTQIKSLIFITRGHVCRPHNP